MKEKRDNPIDPETILSHLVKNALDFLNRAIHELDDAPKYSVIHFHSSMELFLKARLMAEHWTLVVSKRKEPELNQFKSGDFQSVTFEEAADRLKNVIDSGLSPNAFGAFRRIKTHRNKMMHFFHEAQQGEEENKFKNTIVSEQLCAWYWLHRLVTKQWEITFKPWIDDITAIANLIQNHHGKYLQIVFGELGSEIDQMKKQGDTFKACYFCKFEALPFPRSNNEEDGLPHPSKCLVCDNPSLYIRIDCPECQRTVTFINDGSSSCECDQKFDPPRLAELLDCSMESTREKLKMGYSNTLGNCSNCEGYQTVVEIKNGEYFCASCFETFERLEHCVFCGQLDTGDMTDSFVAGCSVCSGVSGWERDQPD